MNPDSDNIRQKINPPSRALRFLRWFCREDYIEEIEGDLVELFEYQHEESPTKAKRRFTWNVVKYFRPAFIKSFKSSYQTNTTAMFRHNFLITIRSYMRHKMSFFINLTGLSAGLACTLLIYLWVADELGKDKFHAKDNRLFMIMQHQQTAGHIWTGWSTPGLLAEGLKEDFPEIEYAAYTTWIDSHTLTFNDKNLKADGNFVGQDFFNIFSFPLIEGKPDQVIKDKNSIVISDELAIRLFNTTEGLIGKSIQFEHDESYLISGIFEKVPDNSTIVFDYLMSFEKYKDKNGGATDWGTSSARTFVILNEGSREDEVSAKIADYIKTKDKDSYVSLFLKQFSDVYLYGNYENGKQARGRIYYVRLFSIIALFILLIACINFMNLFTAKASRRAKEVGMKKAVGASKASIITQYLSESLVLSLISFCVAIVAVYIFLPQFNQITGKEITPSFNLDVMLIFLGITIVSGLISGSYPALYMSGFSILKVLTGQVTGSWAELWARKGLVVFQFSISILLIVSLTVVYKQIEFVQTRHLGYEKDNVIYFSQEGKIKENTNVFISEIKNIPGILSASSIGHNLLYQNDNTSGVDWDGKNPSEIIHFENVRVNYNLIETLGMELLEGRTFSEEFSTESTKIIFNEAAIKVMNMEDPIGKTITLNTGRNYEMEIIGVVKDFHFQSLHEEVKPLFMRLRPNTSNIMARIQAGKEKETLERMSGFCEDFNPGYTFEYKFMDDTYQQHYAAEQRVSTLSQYFAGIAIAISCLGLFGLVSFTAQRRQKEIGIRKVLGASVLSIVRILSGDFTKMVIAAIAIALPISFFLAKRWLEDFAFHMDLKWWYFVISAFSALLIAWLTVGLQTVKAASVNPVNCLRDE